MDRIGGRVVLFWCKYVAQPIPPLVPGRPMGRSRRQVSQGNDEAALRACETITVPDMVGVKFRVNHSYKSKCARGS